MPRATVLAPRLIDEYVERQNSRDDAVWYVDELADPEIHGHCGDSISLFARQPLVRNHPVDNPEQRVARRQCQIFRQVSKRRDLGTVEVRQMRRHPSGVLDRQTNHRVEPTWFGVPELTSANDMWKADRRPRAFDDFAFQRDARRHLDRSTTYLSVALRKMDVTGPQPGTVDQYQKHNRRTHLHCFHIHVAAILARRNRAQPFRSPGAPLSEQSCRDSPFGLRHQHEATGRGERTLAIERLGDLGLARQYAD